MGWVATTPTVLEKERLPAIGSHWINNKIDRAVSNGKNVSEKTMNSRELVVTGYNYRDDESPDSLQISFCLAIDPASSNIFMTPLSSFYDKYRLAR